MCFVFFCIVVVSCFFFFFFFNDTATTEIYTLSLHDALPIPLAQAQADVRFQILVPAALGPPDEAYFSGRFVEGKISLLYRARAGLPEAETTGVGLLLTEFRADIDQQFLGKMLGEGTVIESGTVNGEQGFWIAGA